MPLAMKKLKAYHVMRVTMDRFELIFEFIEHLQNVPVSKDYVFTVLHTFQVTIYTFKSAAYCFFTNRLLKASNV